MTAFGRAQKASKSGRWTVDIHSVNRKGLDISINMPSHLLFFDSDLRKLVQAVAERGQIGVRVDFEYTEIEQSIRTLKTLKQKWVKVAKSLQFPPESVDLKFLLERFDPTEVPLEKEELFLTFKAALKAWQAMKEQEGNVLSSDIKQRLHHIEKELQKIEKREPEVKDQYCQRLKNRMKELQLDVAEERLLREAALLAEKSDITEELTRLSSHLKQMDHYLKSKEKSVGRTLDFLAQELGREINTVMAKAGNAEISKVGIVIKSEIEKIREQVQNIE